MNNKNLHNWWVCTGLYHRQFKVRTEGMEEARKKAYEKLINMSYKEFIKYVSLDVHGCKHKYE